MSWMMGIVIILLNAAFLLAFYIVLHPGSVKKFLDKIDKAITEDNNMKNS